LLPLSDEEDLRAFVMAVAGTELFFVLIQMDRKVYDTSTAMFFAFALGLLARGKFKEFYLLYPLGCMNRETMFLLSIFFAIHYFGKMETFRYLSGLIYQGAVFIGIRLMIMKIFEGNAGQLIYFQPWHILKEHADHPIMLFLLMVLITLTWHRVARRWKEKPEFLRSALFVLLPLQMILYLMVGNAFEVRVFAEVYPVVWALMWDKW
ncbi:MAG TPA: hypothetical protein VI753_17300, partial [Anaerolineales bacterium]|nr:hypothetical protein [Anaerolineales bacterium]